MSYGSFVHEAKQQRAQEAKAARERSLRAIALIAEKVPDLTNDGGTPCPIAVLSVLTLWHRNGEGNARPSEVRAERSAYLTRFEARNGHAFGAPLEEAA